MVSFLLFVHTHTDPSTGGLTEAGTGSSSLELLVGLLVAASVALVGLVVLVGVGVLLCHKFRGESRREEEVRVC